MGENEGSGGVAWTDSRPRPPLLITRHDIWSQNDGHLGVLGAV